MISLGRFLFDVLPVLHARPVIVLALHKSQVEACGRAIAKHETAQHVKATGVSVDLPYRFKFSVYDSERCSVRNKSTTGYKSLIMV